MAAIIPAPSRRSATIPGPRTVDSVGEAPLAVIQTLLALTTTLPALRLVRPLVSAEPGTQRSWFERLWRSLLALFLSTIITQIQIAVTSALIFGAGIYLYLLANPRAKATFDLQKFLNAQEGTEMIVRSFISTVFLVVTVLLDRPFLESFQELAEDMPVFRFVLLKRLALTRALIRVGATMILMGFSLLPLSALRLPLPAFNPSEAVLA